MAKEQQDRRPRGRPALPSDAGKRYSVGIRTTRELKDRLQRAADLSGRSVAQEIEFRLEQAFEMETAFGGPQTQKLLRALAGLAPDDEWVHSWYHRRAVFADWWRRVIDESPSRLASDLIYHAEKYGIDEARQFAISYYSLVTEEFSEHDRQEYCRWVQEIVGLSRDDLVSQNSREGR